MADDIERFSALLRESRRILVFTGAGISTGSNIPDFRGPFGLFRTRSPVYYDAFVSSEAARREYWEFKLASYAAFRDAKPNPAHHAIVTLERLGKVERVVTQNVDGLRRAAGTSPEKLVELHGSNLEVECVGCGGREPPERAYTTFESTREPPRCLSCGELLKPAVVMFGQALDREDLARAIRASESADLVLSLGSSLVVSPAADIPLFGVRRGAPYVIVNRGETPHDDLAALRFSDDVTRVLPLAVGGI